ncbi:probable replicative DNA helicase [Candidatus Phytoplasma mali]|uniref:Probable replicative DNA helicase n=1 Tax=Phytoplasma mali (strain AT) TaxID=482235 RepID=B3QZK0_PHYMT|nr:DnaB-like helicase C-terminal domain-containing protein [Candidatus Phytoplasma mali]CAP18607.1 probable replicative DNA helicase [Candidatus Phytoplasma mali]
MTKNINFKSETILITKLIQTLNSNQSKDIKNIIILLKNVKFNETKYQQIFNLIYQIYQNNSTINLTDFLTYNQYLPNSNINQVLIQELLKTPLISNLELNDNLNTLNNFKIQQQMWLNISTTLNKIKTNTILPNFNELNQLANQILTIPKIENSSSKHFAELIINYLIKMNSGIANLQKSVLTNNFKTLNYLQFNHYFNSISKGKLITYSALTGFGKTTFALNLILEFSDNYYLIHQKYPKIKFLSLEMNCDELLERILAIKTKTNLSTIINKSFEIDNFYTTNGINNGEIYSTQFDEYVNKIKTIPKYNFLIDSFPKFNDINSLENQIRLESRNKNLDMLFIDYLNLIQNPEFTYNPERSIDNIVLRLKTLSVELEIPIFLITQFTKEASKNTKNNDFNVVDMKGSSSISQHSDIVFYLQNLNFKSENEKNHYATTNPIKLLITKNRNGKLGSIIYDFQKKYQTFTEIEPFIEKDDEKILND